MKIRIFTGLYTLIAIIGILHILLVPETTYDAFSAIMTTAALVATGLVSCIAFLDRIITGDWSNLPTGKNLSKAKLRQEIASFYGAALPKKYPNIHFVGTLFRELRVHMKLTDYDNYVETPKPPKDAWISKYYNALANVMDIIHSSVHGKDWLMIVEKTLSDPKYVHTYAYLKNLLDNQEYTDLLHKVSDSSDTTLSPILTEHHQRIALLEQDLRNQFDTIEAAYQYQLRINAAQLNENEFNTLEHIETPQIESQSTIRPLQLSEFIKEPLNFPELENLKEKEPQL